MGKLDVKLMKPSEHFSTNTFVKRKWGQRGWFMEILLKPQTVTMLLLKFPSICITSFFLPSHKQFHFLPVTFITCWNVFLEELNSDFQQAVLTLECLSSSAVHCQSNNSLLTFVFERTSPQEYLIYWVLCAYHTTINAASTWWTGIYWKNTVVLNKLEM